MGSPFGGKCWQTPEVVHFGNGVKAIDVFNLFSGEGEIAFLDSSMEGYGGRYSVVGIRPYAIVEEWEGKTFVNSIPSETGLEGAVNALLADVGARPEGLGPFAIGYVSYDHGMAAQGIESRHPRQGGPAFRFCFYDFLFIEDHASGESYAICHGKIPGSETLLKECLGRPRLPQKVMAAVSHTSNMAKDEYVDAIERMLSLIRDGGAEVVNMTRNVTVRGNTDPVGSYLNLREISPAPYSAYIGHGGRAILCSSMELLLEVHRGTVRTKPIKGTCARTGDEMVDVVSRESLLSSEKEMGELARVTEASVGELSEICVPGTVSVDSFFKCEEYSTVFHTVSEVTGKLIEDVAPMGAFQSVFPGCSVTGVPKHDAMEIIDEFETAARGVYTGSVGYVSRDSCCMNVAIRTIVFNGSEYCFGIGGGITSDSIPEREYEETVQKSLALLNALGGPAGDGTESERRL